VSAFRGIRVSMQPASRNGRGLLDGDHRVRTLRKVLVTYPDVRHILPDRISFDAAVDPRVLEAIAGFLQRQQWLIETVEIT
jgi:hypothetical protein